MTEIQDLFEDAVGVPPPSRLAAEDVLAVSAARRRRRTAATAVVVGVVVAVVVAVGATFSASGTGNPQPAATQPGTLMWAGRADADHLYAVKRICEVPPVLAPSVDVTPKAIEPCSELLASDDGGATWVSRGPFFDVSVRIVGPTSLLRVSSSWLIRTPSAGPPHLYELSRDAGATWSLLPDDGPPIDEVPAGGTLFEGEKRSNLRVFDPAQGRLRPLAHSPNLLNPQPVVTPSPTSTIWVSGYEPASRRPAIAVSHDAGRTWLQRLLPNTEASVYPVTSEDGEFLALQFSAYLSPVAARDDKTAYVPMEDTRTVSPTARPSLPASPRGDLVRMFRTTDGGLTWQDVDPAAVAPGHNGLWFTAGGRMVVGVPPASRNEGGVSTVFRVSDDARTYTVANPPGLPTSILEIDGKLAFSAEAVYVSDDGWTWRQVWHE